MKQWQNTHFNTKKQNKTKENKRNTRKINK